MHTPASATPNCLTRPVHFRKPGLIALALGALAFVTGCRQDMHNQPKFVPQRGTDFYADGRSARPQVENTVARGQLRNESYLYTGLIDGKEGNVLPFPVTAEVLQRGQERYNIFCTPCHSRVGNGAGMIVQRGYKPAGNFHTARLQNAPLGHFYNVIANGYGAMPDYASQIATEDRWAVVAYIKALQLSQNARQADVASGSSVESLSTISEHEGFAPGFAYEWALPATAVYGTPNNEDNGIPGQGNSPLAGTVISKGNSPAPRALSRSTAVPPDRSASPSTNPPQQ